MNRHRLEVREVPGGRAFYIDGSLQFDTRDEAVYHEALALPALALAAARSGRAPSALVLGGGDGLAARRLLDGGARRAELVDYDPGVLELARGEFAALNGGALSDPRVRVYTRDARRHLSYKGAPYDLALADFTFPEDLAGCSLFTRAFFSAVRARLAPGGVFALNALSPDRFPAAFWSLYRTLNSARLYARPLRVAIPSFSAHGYGDWGMFIASARPIKDAELAALRFGPDAALTAAGLREAQRLRVRSLERGLPFSSVIKKPGDLLCLINLQETGPAGGAFADLGDSAAARRLLAGLPGAGYLRWPQLSTEWELGLHETLRLLDWDVFISELEAGAAGLPADLLAELRGLKRKLPELLSGSLPPADRAWQVFALLMTLLVFVNMAYPDNAYAKGGYYGGHGGGSSEMDITFFMQNVRTPFHHQIFQGKEVLMTLTAGGAVKAAEGLRYRAPEAAPSDVKTERLFFSLTDEASITKEGEVFLAAGPTQFRLLAGRDRLVLYDKLLADPVFEFCQDPGVLPPVTGAIEQHIKAADKARASYDKWLAWAAPAAAFSAEIRAEFNEAANLAVVRAALQKASDRLASGPAPAAYPPAQPEWVRLFTGVYLVDDSEIVLAGKNGAFYSYPYLPSRRWKFAAMEASPELDRYITELLTWRNSQLSPTHPMRTVYDMLLSGKANR